MTCRRLLPVAAVLAALSATPAAAQVHVDPGSPSGKEYAIPIESARQNAAKGSGSLASQSSTSSEAAPAPLFGEGIGGEGKRPKASGQRSQRSSSADDNAGGATVGEALAGSNPVGATVPSGGTKSALTIGALALSVLLLGGVIGSIARRRQS